MNPIVDIPVHAAPEEPVPEARDFYVRSLKLLGRAKIPYLVGGGYAMAYYSGIVRYTKDLDVFIRPRDRDRALKAFERAGHRTDVTWPHFLAKGIHGDAFVDLIYRSGNGLCEVDDGWFDHGVRAEVLGVPVWLCPAEETLWSKSYVQERDRFDGADCLHLILRRGMQFDWERLMRRFGDHWRVLLGHLVMFGFVYPGEQGRVPGWVIEQLTNRLRDERAEESRLCRGTLLSKSSYLTAVQDWGFEDVRLPPNGNMTPAEIAHFTAT